MTEFLGIAECRLVAITTCYKKVRTLSFYFFANFLPGKAQIFVSCLVVCVGQFNLTCEFSKVRLAEGRVLRRDETKCGREHKICFPL